MNVPNLDTFWKLVTESRLVAADELEQLRRASTATDTVAAAKWLVSRGALSTWQARRLARGDQGPFFMGTFRLMTRVDAEGPGLLFRAREDRSGRRVQLRLLERSLCKQQDVWTGIVRRTTIAHAARSPVLSKTIAVEKLGSHRVIICEDIPLPTLADELAEQGGLPVEVAVRIVVQVARAVAELHRLDDVHGGISLASLRRESARDAHDARAAGVRLAQFPLAGDPHLQPPRLPLEFKDRIEAMGPRACFVAPELGTPSTVCTVHSDIYALGCLVHALVAGKPVGWQGDARRTLAHVTKDGLPPLVVPGGPATLADVVATMTARDPAMRYRSVVEAADALAACVGMPPESLSPAASAVPSSPLAGNAGSVVSAVAPDSASMTISPPPFAEPSAIVPMINTESSPRPAALRHSSAPAGSRRPRAQKRVSIWATAGLLSVAAVGLVVIVLVLRQQGQMPQDPKREPLKTVSTEKNSPTMGTSPAPPTERESRTPIEESPNPAGTVNAGGRAPGDETMNMKLVASDSLPWGSPTSGPPPALAFLPAGSQLILLARPAGLVADEEGRLFIKALGPQVAEIIGWLESVSGCGLDQIEAVQAGWQADTSGTVVGAYAIRLGQPANEQSIVAALDGMELTREGQENVYVGPTFSLWLPPAEQGHVIVCGNTKLVQAIVAAEARAAPVGDSSDLRAALAPDMERLVGMLDRSRHLTLFGSPQYLRTEGRDILTGSLEQLVEPIKLFFSDTVRAAALSIHAGDLFYIELDAMESVDEPARVMADAIKGKVDALAGDVEDWTAGLDSLNYGRKLINRLPTMMRFLAANTRAGAEGRGVVVNAYLPQSAGHNIALAAELALAQASQSGPTPATMARTTTPTTKPASAQEKLQQKISLSFPRDTLEKSVQMLSEEIGLPINILGGDLQLEGITKNQSFGLNEQNKPAEEILRVILRNANPDGKLIYVIRGAGDGDSLDVTTVAAAAKRGDVVPAVFGSASAETDKK